MRPVGPGDATLSAHDPPQHARRPAEVPLPIDAPLTLTIDHPDPGAATAILATALAAGGYTVEQRRFLDAPVPPARRGTLLIALPGSLGRLADLLQEAATQAALARTLFPATGAPAALLQLKATGVFACLPLTSPARLAHALGALPPLVAALPVPSGETGVLGGGEWVLRWSPTGWEVGAPRVRAPR